MQSNSNIKDKKNRYVIHIRCFSVFTPSMTDFLSKLLFLSKYTNSFEINRSLVEICTNTKLKKNVFDDRPTEILIYYQIPASEQQLQTFESDFINIISHKEDKRSYEQLDHDIRFSIVGVRSIATLSIPQVQYMNNLINKYKKDKLIAKTNSKPCNHHHNFNKRIPET